MEGTSLLTIGYLDIDHQVGLWSPVNACHTGRYDSYQRVIILDRRREAISLVLWFGSR